MSFQEKNSTVTLTIFSLILLIFVGRITQLLINDTFTNAPVFRLWGLVIFLAIIGSVAGMVLTHGVSAALEAFRTGNDDVDIEDFMDERDRKIDSRGTKLTYTVNSLGAFIAMLTFVFSQPPLVMFSLLIFFGVLAQIAGDALRLWLYRSEK